jgi:hypothetical protein
MTHAKIKEHEPTAVKRSTQGTITAVCLQHKNYLQNQYNPSHFVAPIFRISSTFLRQTLQQEGHQP